MPSTKLAINKVDTFGNRLYTLMQIKHLKKTDVAKAMGKHLSNVQRYIDGTYEGKQDVINAISDAFGINPAWLMGYDAPFEVSENNQMEINVEGIISPEEGWLLDMWKKADNRDRETIKLILSRYADEV